MGEKILKLLIMKCTSLLTFLFIFFHLYLFTLDSIYYCHWYLLLFQN